MDAKVQHIVIMQEQTIRDNDKSMSHEAIGLLITYRCNFDCKYCYIHTKRNLDMTLEKAQSIIGPFLNKDYGYLDITFVGGETLLAMNVIKPLVEWVEKGKWKKKYRFLGATNGTLLTKEMKQWFNDRRSTFTLGLSYDGLPSTQEKNRGRTEIDLDYFIKTWPAQPIQMTINADSVLEMAEGVIYLLERGAVVHPNVAYEQYEWKKEDIIEYGKQLEKLARYYNEHQDLSLITQFQHDLTDYVHCIEIPKEQVQVCGAGCGYKVYDVDGKVYPCHILSPLVLNKETSDKVINELAKTSVFADPKCKHCPYVSNCPTCIGCNYIYRKDFNNRDDTHCRIMRTEVRAFLKKEIMRLKSKDKLTAKDASDIENIRKIFDYEKTHKIF